MFRTRSKLMQQTQAALPVSTGLQRESPVWRLADDDLSVLVEPVFIPAAAAPVVYVGPIMPASFVLPVAVTTYGSTLR